MFSIKTMCERVIYLKRGRVVYDGPTDEGLKLYENDSRLQDAPWFQDDSAKASMAITDVKLLDENGKEAGVFDFGSRMKVRIHYRAFRPIEKPDFRVGINRSDEIHCSTFSTVADKVDIPMVQGEGMIELRTPPIQLVSDLYTATISVRERSYGRLLCAQIGGSFHVRHPVYASNAFGVYHESGEWRVPQPEQLSQTVETADGLR